MNNNFWKIFILVLAIFFLSSLIINAAFYLNKDNKNSDELSITESFSLTETASAGQIYPLFECPCCGTPINECTCPMAKERMAFVDGVTAVEISEDEAILTYVKKYGLSSFIEKEKEDEFRNKLAESAPDDRPIISLNPESFNFKDVSQKKGVVTTTLEVKNNGKNDLVIDRLETSCGCTSASIIYQEEEGPVFNMPGHGVNEEIGEWQISIAPGTSAELKIYYDPNMHPEFRGAATREVYVFSNDPIDFQKKVSIELNQID